MFNFGYLIVAAAAITVATAKPHASPRSLNINDMKNNTVCAINVKINEDLNRIPQRIKEIKCATQTDQWCAQNKIPHHECCHHTKKVMEDPSHVMECAEMTDKVQVFYKDRNESMWLEVAVGCTCVIAPSTVAPAAPGPW